MNWEGDGAYNRCRKQMYTRELNRSGTEFHFRSQRNSICLYVPGLNLSNKPVTGYVHQMPGVADFAPVHRHQEI